MTFIRPSHPSRRPLNFHAPVGALLGLLAVVGCGNEDHVLVPTAEGCNPIAAEWKCGLPYPSDVFLVDDEDMPSGHRVAIPDAALPHKNDGEAIDLFDLHPADGFSPGTQIVAVIPKEFATSGLVNIFEDPRDAADPESKTILIDTETGKLVPHFAETDVDDVDVDSRALIIRPAARLESGRRYVVAIQALTTKDGKLINAPDGFARLRNGKAKGQPGIGDLVTHYEEDIFPVLAEAGVGRRTLTLAWDFTTRTYENAAKDLEDIRTATLAAYESKAPVVKITKVTDDVDAHIARRIEGTITVPLFLESAEPSALLVRNADGVVTSTKTVKVPFLAIIPRSVAEREEDAAPARILQYGHGVFGSREEIAEPEGFMPAFADEFGFVVVAVDWWGMSSVDVAAILGVIGTNTNNTLSFTDRVHQAMANQLALGEAAARSFSTLPAFQVNEVPTFDPAHVYYDGNSLGHIFGSTYLALSPRIERAALGVGGADFSHFIVRSASFSQFLLILNTLMPDPSDVQLFVAMAQNSFDRVDPVTYAPKLFDDPYEGAPKRKVLIQFGVGDATVPNMATLFQARSLGLPVLENSALAVPMLDTVEAPTKNSAITIFDSGLPVDTGAALESMTRNGVHEGVRKVHEGQQQINAFLKEGGKIEDFCDGEPCTVDGEKAP